MTPGGKKTIPTGSSRITVVRVHLCCIGTRVHSAMSDVLPMMTSMSSFTDRSYRVARDGRTVVCDTIAQRDELATLRDAIAWQRDRQSWMALDDAESVLALRALTMVDDLLAEATAYESEALVTLSRDHALALCSLAGTYVTERDIESYQPPEERERIARLRAIAGPLMDTCCELAAAEDEAREKELLTS